MDEAYFQAQLRKAKAQVVVAEHKYIEWLVSCGLDFRTAYRYVRSLESPDAIRIELKLREAKNEESNHNS